MTRSSFLFVISIFFYVSLAPLSLLFALEPDADNSLPISSSFPLYSPSSSPLLSAFLSLDQAIMSTLKNQPAVQFSTLNIQLQEGVAQSAAAPFDPVSNGSLHHTYSRDVHYESTNQKTELAAHETNLIVNGSKQTRLGTIFSSGLLIDQVLNPLILQGTPPLLLTNSNSAAIFFQVTQPLLRNLYNGQNSVVEKAASLELKAVQLDTIQTISQLVSTTIQRYWEVVSAKKIWEIQKEAGKNFERLANEVRALNQGDQVASIEIKQALARVATQNVEILRAQENFYNAYQLLNLAMGQIGTISGDRDVLVLNDFPSVDLNIEEIRRTMPYWIDYGMQHRYDILAAKWREEVAEILLQGAYNGMLPQLDLIGRVAQNDFNLGKRAKPLFSALKMRRPETDWMIGVNFSMPLYNDGAKGAVKQQQALKGQAFWLTQQLIQLYFNDAYEAFSSQISSFLEWQEANLSVQRYQLVVEGELEKLREGQSSLFFVIDLQNKLITALVVRTNIHKQYMQNIGRLRFLLSTLLNFDEGICNIKIADLTKLPSFHGEF